MIVKVKIPSDRELSQLMDSLMKKGNVYEAKKIARLILSRPDKVRK